MKKLLAIIVLGLLISGCSTTTTRNIEINKLKIKETTDASLCKTGSHFSLYLTGKINEDASLVVEKLLSQQAKCINKKGTHIVPSVNLDSSGGYLKDGFVVDSTSDKSDGENNDEEESECESSGESSDGDGSELEMDEYDYSDDE